MLRRNFAIVIAAALVVLGCDRGPSEPQSVFSVSPENPYLFPEASIKLDLSLNPAAISPAQILWSSSSPNVASVDENGRVTGISPGSAVIKAKGTNGFVETTVTVVAGGAPFHAGYSVTCGISTTNETYCWGDNAGGQLGIGTTGSAQPLPQRVSGGLQFSSIGGGYGHTCGMTAAGAFCWGEAWWGAIGDGTRGDFSRMVPTKVVSGESLLQVDANGGRNLSGAECSDEICHGHSVGLDNSGRAFWWGTELHSGTPSTGLIAVQSLVPTPVETDQRFFRISAGVEYTCGITTDHAAYCWGLNSQGESGGASSFVEPHAVDGAPPLQSISAGRSHTCGLSLDGDAYCWGSNSAGELGATSSETCVNGRFACRRTAAKVEGYKFIAISVGPGTLLIDAAPLGHTCGITVTQSIVCWGDNSFGQLGNGSTQSRQTPTPIALNLKWKSLNAGHGYTCAVAQDGGGYCWGLNSSGQLGTGTFENSSTPVRISNVAAFK